MPDTSSLLADILINIFNNRELIIIFENAKHEKIGFLPEFPEDCQIQIVNRWQESSPVDYAYHAPS
jgi:hypothetical protein